MSDLLLLFPNYKEINKGGFTEENLYMHEYVSTGTGIFKLHVDNRVIPVRIVHVHDATKRPYV